MFKKFFSLFYYPLILYLVILIFSLCFFMPIFAYDNYSFSNKNDDNENSAVFIGLSNFFWPVPGYSTITSYFGYRTAPTVGASTYHSGIDIAAPARR